MGEKDHFENDELKKEKDYPFVKEVIKKKTIRPRDVLIRLGCIAGGAVLFGIIAAFVFARFLPVMQKEEEAMKPIDFEEDIPDPAVTAELTPTPEKTPASESTQDLDSSSDPGDNAAGDSFTGDDSSGDNSSEDDHTTDNPSTVPGKPGSVEDPSGEISKVGMYNEMYGEMQKIAQDAMRCMVNVTGITNNEDWFSVQSDYSKQASGFIVAGNGQELYILTEYKVVDTVERVVITFCDGTMIDGRYQMHDPNTGLTILKVAMDDLTSETKDSIAIAKLGNSYHVSQGEAVIAIGSPMGYSNSVVYGQITSTTNTISTYDKQYNLFTTNMMGNDSGSGAVINLNGEIVSVIAQSFSDEQHKNVIIGLPISQLKNLIETLSNGGELPYLGIKGQNVTAEVMNQTGMPKGIYVASLNSDSPALHMGMRNGDIIIKYNGEAVETVSQYSDKLFHTNVGAVVKLTIMRKSTEGYREFEYEVVTGTW